MVGQLFYISQMPSAESQCMHGDACATLEMMLVVYSSEIDFWYDNGRSECWKEHHPPKCGVRLGGLVAVFNHCDGGGSVAVFCKATGGQSLRWTTATGGYVAVYGDCDWGVRRSESMVSRSLVRFGLRNQLGKGQIFPSQGGTGGPSWKIHFCQETLFWVP